MKRTPRIAIPVPTSFDIAYNDQSWPDYARAVEISGGKAVRVELGQTPAELLRSAQECDGVLLPGSGADVSPERYGHERQPETAPADPLRETTDKLLLEHLEREGKPLLAICFGLQSLNVYRGGTLVQHLQPMPVNHRAGRSVTCAHAAMIVNDSRLGRIFVKEATYEEQAGYKRLMVNSSHHQAIGTPGDQLRIVARSTEDAVIEALEDESHPWLIGVQWHPERTLEQSAASRELLQAFVDAAGQSAR